MTRFRLTGLVTALLLVIAALVVGVGLWMIHQHKPAAPATSTLSDAQVQQVLSQANNDNARGKYDDAITALGNALPKVSASNKQAVYLALGAAYMNKHDYANALANYQQADQIKSGYGTTQAVGDAAAAAGNKQLAISSYQKCIALAKSGATGSSANDIPVLQDEIRALGGTP